jgi:osmotically inducible protein OsmC
MGEPFMLADIQMFYTVELAEYLNFLDQFPALRTYLDRLRMRPAYAAAIQRWWSDDATTKRCNGSPGPTFSPAKGDNPMKITRRSSAHWTGGLKDGQGALTTASGALKAYPYGFNSRFGDKVGTNPEELLGVAHSGCFTMALTLVLGEAGFTAEALDTTADVTIEQVEGRFSISAVHLTLRAKIPGLDPNTFTKIAEGAKANCPVSKALKADITLDAALVA